MARHAIALSLEDAEDLERRQSGDTVSYTASLVIQGRHRFYTLTMPSDVLAENSTVDRRAEKPIEGFQRFLDEDRAQDIADYIDSGFGTIPGSIVLSAQPEAKLQYTRRTRTLSFKRGPNAFLILDGQHRVYGFARAKARLRVPVVIYNGLAKSDEVRLFMDINTKQRPVPNELLLDIKRMAETESSQEAMMRDVFDALNKDAGSPLLGLMSPSERKKGRISRVTFNAALKPIFDAFGTNESSYVSRVVSAYLQAWISGLRSLDAADKITNPTLFRGIMLLFPAVARRSSDRYGEEYTVDNFAEVLTPVLSRLKRSDVQQPGNSPSALFDLFRRHLESGFSIGRGRAS